MFFIPCVSFSWCCYAGVCWSMYQIDLFPQVFYSHKPPLTTIFGYAYASMFTILPYLSCPLRASWLLHGLADIWDAERKCMFSFCKHVNAVCPLCPVTGYLWLAVVSLSSLCLYMCLRWLTACTVYCFPAVVHVCSKAGLLLAGIPEKT